MTKYNVVMCNLGKCGRICNSWLGAEQTGTCFTQSANQHMHTSNFLFIKTYLKFLKNTPTCFGHSTISSTHITR